MTYVRVYGSPYGSCRAVPYLLLLECGPAEAVGQHQHHTAQQGLVLRGGERGRGGARFLGTVRPPKGHGVYPFGTVSTRSAVKVKTYRYTISHMHTVSGNFVGSFSLGR